MKVWFALLLVTIGLVAAPSANAFDASAGGFGWLQSKAVRHGGWIHFHGPLYNYGPYYGGPGYQTMNVHPGFHNGYHPAYPQAVYGGGYGNGYSAGPVTAAPATSAPVTSGTSSPAPAISSGSTHHSHYNSMMPSEPANLYPNYLTAPAWNPIR